MMMKNKTRRSFTDDCKREAVLLLTSSGQPLIQVAARLSIQPSMLRSWRGPADGAAKPLIGSSLPASKMMPSADQIEIRRLRRELEQAQMERDVLKKSHRHLLGSSEMRFCFIEDNRQVYPVRLMCAVL